MMLKGQWPGQIRVAPNSGPGDMSGPIESVIEIGTWPTGIQLKPKSSLEKSHVNGKELLPASRLHFLHEPGMMFWRPGQGKSRSGIRAVAWVLTRCCMPRSPSCSLPGHHSGRQCHLPAGLHVALLCSLSWSRHSASPWALNGSKETVLEVEEETDQKQ